MQSYSYFKKLAKKSLQGNFVKCIIAFLFVSLLPTLTSAINTRFSEYTIPVAVTGLISSLILIPCFKMGAIEYLFETIRKNKPPLGNMFNGFKYIFKLIPIGIARLISFLPLIIVSIVLINMLPKETMDILTEYYNNPSDAEILNAIPMIEYKTMFFLECLFIISAALSIYLNTHLSLCEYILCNEGISGIKSVFKSIKLMNGHILYYIGFSLSFILWVLAGAFTGGISNLILYPYQQTSYIMLYMELLYRNSGITENTKENIENNEDTIKEDTI